jgi:NADH-quinone oxidoreductase subunit N
LCATEIRKRRSIEAGLKYVIIGSVGSGTLLYGLAFVYGATGATDFTAISTAIGERVSATDPLLLTGIALAAVGLAFKASVAPFHQWTPDVYQGAPTPVTSFMAVATKAAAFAVFLRLFIVAFPDVQPTWSDALAALAIITILVGNSAAIPQRSMKRLLAWSGVGQAGYILTGVIVATQLGMQAMVFYLAVYLVMNMAAFAVVIARERVSPAGDDISSFAGLGRADPWLAWPLTIAMLGLAGFPVTAGFIGKFYLLQAAVDGGFDWLAVFIVIGSVISLGYYLRVVAAMWLGPSDVTVPTSSGGMRRLARVSGWSPLAMGRAQPEVLAVALIMGAAVIVLGVFPSPLLDVAKDVGTSLSSIFN